MQYSFQNYVSTITKGTKNISTKTNYVYEKKEKKSYGNSNKHPKWGNIF